MFYFNLASRQYQRIHFIGIGGVSMSGIAELLWRCGYEISGSDRGENAHTKHLESLGIPVAIGQSKRNIQQQDLFIYTDAIFATNEELVAARDTGKPCISRGEFLGALMRNYQHSIAVSGSHGKSTTTSMITKILLTAPTDPTILLGGSLDEIEGNVKTGCDEYFLAEACEYKGNIRYYYPQIAVVLNIDEDHLDYYKNLDNIIQAFQNYMQNLTKDSIAVLNVDDAPTRQLRSCIPGRLVTYGVDSPDAMYRATNIVFDDLGRPSFDLVLPDGSIEPFRLAIIGRYNIHNALAAIATCYETGLSIGHIRLGLENYRPLHRRMEIVGQFQNATVMTDYGHHPTEIRSTLEALAEHKPQRLICVFQPHTFSRTKLLMREFSEAFFDADEVVVTKIDAAREMDDGSVDARELVKALQTNGVQATYCETFEDAEEYLSQVVHTKDLILTTGCGTIDELAYQLAKNRPAFA